MSRVPATLVVANLVTLGLTLVLNGLANALPLNGQTTGEVSDRFPNLFAPAGYVFSIWGAIYLGLLAFAAYQLTAAGRRSRAVQRVGGWFALSGIANSVWIVFWHYELFLASMAAMLVLLISLCAMASRLGAPRQAESAGDRWLVYLPFSIYLGWISVATIANAAVVLLDLGWDGAPLSPATWTLLLLAVATGLGVWFLGRRGDLAYAAVLVWAFVGIWARQGGISGPVGETAVAQGALVAAGVLIVTAVWRVARGVVARPTGGRGSASYQAHA